MIKRSAIVFSVSVVFLGCGSKDPEPPFVFAKGAAFSGDDPATSDGPAMRWWDLKKPYDETLKEATSELQAAGWVKKKRNSKYLTEYTKAGMNVFVGIGKKSTPPNNPPAGWSTIAMELPGGGWAERRIERERIRAAERAAKAGGVSSP